MSDPATSEAVHAARLTLVMLAAWSVVVGMLGRSGPLFPEWARVSSGLLFGAWCAVVAVWPSPGRLRWAFSGVAAYAAYSASRTLIVQPFDDKATIVAATTYAAVSAVALLAGVATAIVAGIDRAGEWKPKHSG